MLSTYHTLQSLATWFLTFFLHILPSSDYKIRLGWLFDILLEHPGEKFNLRHFLIVHSSKSVLTVLINFCHILCTQPLLHEFHELFSILFQNSPRKLIICIFHRSWHTQMDGALEFSWGFMTKVFVPKYVCHYFDTDGIAQGTGLIRSWHFSIYLMLLC